MASCLQLYKSLYVSKYVRDLYSGEVSEDK